MGEKTIYKQRLKEFGGPEPDDIEDGGYFGPDVDKIKKIFIKSLLKRGISINRATEFVSENFFLVGRLVDVKMNPRSLTLFEKAVQRLISQL